MIDSAFEWKDWWRWGAPLLLCGSIWLLPVSLQAQPFDVETRRHAVVRILGGRGNNIGSGSLIKVEGTTGYILTAYHVIQRDMDQGKTSVKVEFYTEQEVDARMSRNRIDLSNDIAVLVIEPLPAKPSAAIPLGSAGPVRETQRVYALGHPSAEATWAITEGTVSRKQGGKLHFSGTAVNRGNSGGPLLDEQGVLVAMNLRLGKGLGSALTWDAIRPLIDGWVPGLSAVPHATIPPLVQQPVLTPTRRGKDKKDMLLVPEGWFRMGSTEEEVKAAVALGKNMTRAPRHPGLRMQNRSTGCGWTLFTWTNMK